MSELMILAGKITIVVFVAIGAMFTVDAAGRLLKRWSGDSPESINIQTREWPWFYFPGGPDESGAPVGVYRMCKACSRVDRGSLHGWEINDGDTYCEHCTPKVPEVLK